MLTKVKTVAKKMFSKYLIVTNTIACGSLLALGDGITQHIEKRSYAKANNNIQPSSAWSYNWPRSGRMFIVGLFLGPFNHFWYGLLDRVIKGSGGKVVLKKILCDQTVAAPVFCSSFFLGMALLEGQGVDAAVAELKEKFLPVYLIDWCVWPPAQAINFYFLPTHLRVVYVSFMTLMWNSFLSYVKHREQVKEQMEEKKD